MFYKCNCYPSLFRRPWSLISSLRKYYRDSYSLEANEKILKTVNECTDPLQLEKFKLAKTNCTKIFQFVQKQDNGIIQDIDELIGVVNDSALKKFFDYLTKEEVESSKNKVIRNPVLFLPGASYKSSGYNEALSIITSGTTVGWSFIKRCDGKLRLDKVAVEKIDLVPRAHFLATLDNVKGLVNGIPSSQLYVFEELSSMAPSPQQYAYTIQRTQLRSFIMGNISSRGNAVLSSVKTAAVGRLFRLHVGNERVSGQDTVEKLMTTGKDFSVSEEARYTFLNREPQEREYIANAVLLNLSYWKLSELISV